MATRYAIGLDFGTNSVRALVVRASNGYESGTHVFDYRQGEVGVLLEASEPDLARQHPRDYLEGCVAAVRGAIADAERRDADFQVAQVAALGVDTTGSTPIPVDAAGMPLALQPRFASNLNAMAWLWKDHTSHDEARRITEAAAARRPQYLAKCGGVYSSEWFFSKIWRCLNVAPDVFEAAHTWLEHVDYMTGVLTGEPKNIKRSVCAGGHKAMFGVDWGGYPDAEFLGGLHPALGELRGRLPGDAYPVGTVAGRLCEEWATKLGLSEGIPISVGALDAHLGAVGSGVRPGVMVKILGTSACDMIVAAKGRDIPDIPGICGMVDGSILPGMWGLEAGQSAVGDLFNWWVNEIKPTGETHESLTKQAKRMRAGESGLLALDWNGGNRCVLVDPRLSGLIVGQSLHTKPHEVYRALIEATAFGARIIIERFREYGVTVERMIAGGGIADKNPVALQIYADVLGLPIRLSRSDQTCALGAAMCGAVAAGIYPDFASAQAAMGGVKDLEYRPNRTDRAVYDELFKLYRDLHDAFGTSTTKPLGHVMKQLLDIRDRTRTS